MKEGGRGVRRRREEGGEEEEEVVQERGEGEVGAVGAPRGGGVRHGGQAHLQIWGCLGNISKLGVFENTPKTRVPARQCHFLGCPKRVRPVCGYKIIFEGTGRDGTPPNPDLGSQHCTGAPPSNGAPS